MDWLENALANVNLEAINDILVFTAHVLQSFRLDIGTGDSFFEKTIPISGFSPVILALATLIVVIAALVKLYITMLSPFERAESPGDIAVRLVLALFGVHAAQKLFFVFEAAFDVVYVQFVGIYEKIATDYANAPFAVSSPHGPVYRFFKNMFGGIGGVDPLDKKLQGLYEWFGGKIGAGIEDLLPGDKNSDSFNFFGGDTLFNPENAVIKEMGEAPLGLLLLELIIGCTLIIAFFRLVLEVYERYVLLGVMYFTSPLAFASIISKDAVIFKNWMQMLVAQFILMCTNLMFVGGFMLAWYNIVTHAQKVGYVYESPQQYIATMMALIGWLIIGQKFDQHLKEVGLSTAQTGQGIMGALAGGMVLAKASFGAARGAYRTGRSVTGKVSSALNPRPDPVAESLSGISDQIEDIGKKINNSGISRTGNAGADGLSGTGKNGIDIKNPVMSSSEALKKYGNDPEKLSEQMKNNKAGLESIENASKTAAGGNYKFDSKGAFFGDAPEGSPKGTLVAYDLKNNTKATLVPGTNPEKAVNTSINGQSYGTHLDNITNKEAEQIKKSESYKIFHKADE